jgi:hypothetical protein
LKIVENNINCTAHSSKEERGITNLMDKDEDGGLY